MPVDTTYGWATSGSKVKHAPKPPRNPYVAPRSKHERKAHPVRCPCCGATRFYR